MNTQAEFNGGNCQMTSRDDKETHCRGLKRRGGERRAEKYVELNKINKKRNTLLLGIKTT